MKTMTPRRNSAPRSTKWKPRLRDWRNWNREKHLAIQAEDFEAAKQIKTEIDRLRAASFSLKELNKIAIESLAVNIPKLARDISAIKLGTRVFPTKTGAGAGVGGGGGAMAVDRRPGIPTEIYNAEDFQSQKRQEIEMKMRDKEAEMRSYFEVPRPPEIDFSDFPRDNSNRLKSRSSAPAPAPASEPVVEVVHLDAPSPFTAAAAVPPGPGDDSPFRGGDDMDRLIAERIAARQRDMEEITERMKSSMPPSQQPLPIKEYNPNEFVQADTATLPMPPMPPQSEDTRKVRFREDMDSIFLKLKRKPMTENE